MLRAGLAFVTIALPLLGWTQDHARTVGPTDRGCQSSFALGYTQCVPAARAPAAAASAPSQIVSPRTQPAPGEQAAAISVSEADIDVFLTHYGKPSREAVRALLDPTDANIAAMARRIRQDAAVASYVAGRMTSLQEIDPGLVAINPAFNSQDLPWLAGMRVVLHVAQGCLPCEAAAIALQRLVAESPVLDARVVVHGTATPQAMTLELGRLGITLPATAAQPASARFAKSVPIAAIADMRRGTEGVLTRFGTTQDIRNAVAAFRRQADEPRARN